MSNTEKKTDEESVASVNNRKQNISLALQQVGVFMDLLSISTEISLEDKIKELRQISELVTQAEQQLLPEPKPAPFTYTGRPIPRMSGIDFLKKYYGDYLGKTLHLGHIRSFDISLYRKLMRERRENNGQWPQEISLPTKNAAIDKEISLLSSREIEKIKRLAANLKTR